MPKILREKVPEGLIRHLLLRMRQRGVSVEDLGLLNDWINANPTVPVGRWYKRFPTFIVCGEGELIKTFLMTGQLPDGQEVN